MFEIFRADLCNSQSLLKRTVITSSRLDSRNGIRYLNCDVKLPVELNAVNSLSINNQFNHFYNLQNIEVLNHIY